MLINRKKIGSNEQVYMIAEIGSNHNQDKSRALEMIDMAAESGADAVKFQSIKFDKLYHTGYESLDFRKWFEQIELDENWYPELSKRASEVGVDFISAPTYVEAIDLLEECNVPAYKIASPQVQGNHDVLRKAAQTQKPLIMSLGYSNYSDINRAIAVVKEEGNENIVLLHCVSKYPMEPEEANLRFINTLGQMTGYPIGFSDHSLDDHVSIAAVALGACVIEKHVTIDRAMPGPDHGFAMTFDEYKKMASRIRDTSMALGDGIKMQLLAEEQQYRNNVVRKLFIKRPIRAGENVVSDDIMRLRHVEGGIPETDEQLVYKCSAREDISEGALLSWNQLVLENQADK